jgi:single-strand DNA-binding protein
MSSLNKVQIIGNLGGDPEARSMPNGEQVVSLTVATSETWTDKNSGEKREKTEWHRVVVFNEPIGRTIMKYCSKGDKIYLEGKLRTRKWEKDGIDRYSTEIVVERFSGQMVLLGGRGGQGGSNGAPEPSSGHNDDLGDLDDNVPF